MTSIAGARLLHAMGARRGAPRHLRRRHGSKPSLLWDNTDGPTTLALAVLPGGGIEVGENFDNAFGREVKEEVGLKARNATYLYDFPYPSGWACVIGSMLTLVKQPWDRTRPRFACIREWSVLIGCPLALLQFEPRSACHILRWTD